MIPDFDFTGLDVCRKRLAVLQAGGDSGHGYGRGVRGVDGTNPECFEPVPEAGEGGIGVAVVGAAADAVEGPAKPFEDGLAAAVGFPAVGAVIGVPVEFDRQAAASALDDEVDAEAAYPVLDFDTVSASDEVAVDVALEVGVEAVLYVAGGVVDPCGVLAVADESGADVVGVQFVGGDGADAPFLVLGAAGSDVDPLPVGVFGHRPDAPTFACGDDQGQEHDVSFVALEVVGVAAADPPPFHLLLA
jgi:hypothetical protein